MMMHEGEEDDDNEEEDNDNDDGNDNSRWQQQWGERGECGEVKRSPSQHHDENKKGGQQ